MIVVFIWQLVMNNTYYSYFRYNIVMCVCVCVCVCQRRRRHFKSGQATATKRSLMHVNGVGGVGESSATGK